MPMYCRKVSLSILLFPFLLCFSPVHAAGPEQWRPNDTVFEVSEELATPFEVEAVANVTGPQGEKLDVPMFFDGGQKFILRFAPPTPGEWKYSIRSTVKSLDGKSGEIQTIAAANGRHGPVGVASDSRQRFAYADGTNYFPIAFECDWLFALDAANKTDIPKTRELADTIARHGFNQVVMNVYAYDVMWPADPKLPQEFNYARPGYSPFGGTNDAPDFSTLNVEFFQHLDRVIAALDERGIVAHLMIYVWNKKVNWPESRSEADNRYFDYVVKRYQAYPNIIWDISKEALGYGHSDMTYITDRVERLRKLDAYDRLVTVHDHAYCAKYPDLVDFISIQIWTSELFAAMKEVRAKHPQKPILNIEHGGYEAGPYHVFTGDYLSAEVCLERAYECVFAGTFPTHYWQDTSWSVVIHNPDSLPEKQRPRLHYYQHLATMVNKPGFADLEPASGKFSSSGMCLTDGKKRFVYFIPKENSAVQLRNLQGAEGEHVRLTWFNPHTGESMPGVERKIEKYISVQRPDWDHFGILNAEIQ